MAKADLPVGFPYRFNSSLIHYLIAIDNCELDLNGLSILVGCWSLVSIRRIITLFKCEPLCFRRLSLGVGKLGLSTSYPHQFGCSKSKEIQFP